MRPGDQNLLKTIRLVVWSVCMLLALMVVLLVLLFFPQHPTHGPTELSSIAPPGEWNAPDSTLIPDTPAGELIRYGYELVAHTSVYLGPNGKVSQKSNGMNCQNCHLKAGKKSWGNNYSAVASTYPKFRGRSGTLEGIERRVNDCLQRSLNGQALEAESREMAALVAYIRWVGSEVPQGQIPPGAGIVDLPVLERAANPELGELIFDRQCSRCHGSNGEGKQNPGGKEWMYPPLWGEKSFNTGAGILRLSRMAGFIHRNMPNDAQDQAKRLSETEAWDVAAFICSQPRPLMDISADWPDISQKPFDHPFGPYADSFTEQQHKFGPFGPILAATQNK